MATRYRNYAGLFPNYQALGQQKAQTYQRNAGEFGNLLGALSQIAIMAEKDKLAKQQQEEANSLFRQGTGTLVTTDLLNKPITPTYTGQQPSFDYGRANQLSLTNPMAKQALEQAMKGWQSVPAGGVKVNPVTNDTLSNPKPPVQPKETKVGVATKGNRKVAVYKRPDGTTYDVDLGESFEGERLKNAKAGIELAKKRFEQSANRELKSEGKFYIQMFDRAEKEYNRNQLYLSDENISPAMKAQIEQQQIELLQEMGSIGQSIDALGSTIQEVVQSPKPKPQPKPSKAVKRTGKTKDGRSVVEYTDGTIEYK